MNNTAGPQRLSEKRQQYKIKLFMDSFHQHSDMNRNSNKVSRQVCRVRLCEPQVGSQHLGISVKQLAIYKKKPKKKTTTKQHCVLLLSVPFADVATCQERISPVLIWSLDKQPQDVTHQLFKKEGKKKWLWEENLLAKPVSSLFSGSAASLDSDPLPQCHCQPRFHRPLLPLHRL